MATFQITARSLLVSATFTAALRSSGEAAERTAELFGDQPFGITVTKLCEAQHG
jgi:hypothetical protein